MLMKQGKRPGDLGHYLARFLPARGLTCFLRVNYAPFLCLHAADTKYAN